MKARVFTTSQSRLESCDCLLAGNRLGEIHSVHNPFLVIETKPLLTELQAVRLSLNGAKDNYEYGGDEMEDGTLLAGDPVPELDQALVRLDELIKTLGGGDG